MLNERNFIDDKLKHTILMVRVLYLLKTNKKAYPYDLLKKLKDKRNPVFFDLDKNDIYNAVNALEGKGFIKYLSAKGDKKYYRITSKGIVLLQDSKVLLARHLKEVQKMLDGK